MLLERKGYPQEDEMVLVTITKVNPSSVFVVLDHYGRKTGLIHISEVSPGRIRNIRDYVVEGKKAVCKILRVDEEKGHIDVSLRRVTEIQRRNFNDAVKQEQKAEKLLQQFGQQNKLAESAILKKIVEPVHGSYEFIHEFFTDVVEQKVKVSDFIKEAALAKNVEAYVKERIQPPQVTLEAKIELHIYQPNGVLLIKDALSKLEDKQTTVRYKGAGQYVVSVVDKEYKPGEKVLQKKLAAVEAFADEHKGTFVSER